MARFTHTVLVAPVPPKWCEESLTVLLDLAEETRAEGARILLPDGQVVPDVRLVAGEHLRPGASYEIDDPEADEQVRCTVTQWDRGSALRAELAVRHEEGELNATAALLGGERPHTVEIRGRTEAEGTGARLLRWAGEGRLDHDGWWNSVSGRGTSRTPSRGTVRTRKPAAPLDVHLEHRLARATLRVTPRSRHGRWALRCTLTVRGRSLLRPVATVGLLLARRRIRRFFVELVDGVAARWNEVVPGAAAMDSGQLREAMLGALQEATGEQADTQVTG